VAYLPVLLTLTDEKPKRKMKERYKDRRGKYHLAMGRLPLIKRAARMCSRGLSAFGNQSLNKYLMYIQYDKITKKKLSRGEKGSRGAHEELFAATSGG